MAILLLIVALVGLLISVVGSIWLLVVAFKESIGWGLAVVFIPFAGLAFVLMHWDEASKPFLINIAGVACLIVVSLNMPAARGTAHGGPGSAFQQLTAAPSLKAITIKENMSTVQAAVEGYAKAHNGGYPRSIELLKPYFPGGNPPSSDGQELVNPFTAKKEWPIMGSVKDVSATRKEAPGELKEGLVEYSLILDKEGQPTSYAIRGGDKGGKAVANAMETGTMVLSNM